MSTTEKRMLGEYEVIHALHIGDREIIVGDNPNAPKDERFMCVTCQYIDIFIKPENAVVSDDFTEIIQEYGSRLAVQAEKTSPFVIKPKIQGIDTRVLTEKDCRRIDSSDNLFGKILVIKPTPLRREYQMCTNQIMLCTGGFGASPTSRGNACFCVDLYTGKQCRQERPDVMGTLERSQLPKWAELTLVQHEQKTRKDRGDAR
jgi:hypothetical protein